MENNYICYPDIAKYGFCDKDKNFHTNSCKLLNRLCNNLPHQDHNNMCTKIQGECHFDGHSVLKDMICNDPTYKGFVNVETKDDPIHFLVLPLNKAKEFISIDDKYTLYYGKSFVAIDISNDIHVSHTIDCYAQGITTTLASFPSSFLSASYQEKNNMRTQLVLSAATKVLDTFDTVK